MSSDKLLRATLALYHDTSGRSTSSSSSLSPRPPPPPPPAPAALPDRVFGTTTSLLTTLNNPLNVSLLTSHFLTAPAVWTLTANPNSADTAARICFRVISVYNTAALHVLRREREEQAAARHGLTDLLRTRYFSPLTATSEARKLSSAAWTQAVAQGCSSSQYSVSPRWRHVLVLVGVLLGFESDGRAGLASAQRAALEQGVVTAANLALREEAAHPQDEAAAALARHAVVLGLTFAFPLLTPPARAALDADALLPCVVAALTGPFGFDGGSVLSAIQQDPAVSASSGNNTLSWPPSAMSFRLLAQQIETRPLVASAGPAAALAAFAAAHAQHPLGPVTAAVGELSLFAAAVSRRWALATRLSAWDVSLEPGFLTAETARITWPLLWQHLKKMLYAAVVVLQAVVARSVVDPALNAPGTGPGTGPGTAPRRAADVLRILGHLAFVSSRQGADAFQAYRFAYLASVDVVAQHPLVAEELLDELLCAAVSLAPQSQPLRRTADLFYLNLAEHVAAVVSHAAAERLIVQPAVPYISPSSSTPSLVAATSPSPLLVDVFEAAHSAVLAVLSVPRSAPLAASLSPFYAEALFASFPIRISARQFRLAFRTLVQILSPPFPVYATHPALAETLLEMVLMRAETASAVALPTSAADASEAEDDETSEQSALVLTLIDALPFLALPVLENWLTTAAEAVWLLANPRQRHAVQRRFWEVLGSGEMDVERAERGVSWWGDGGGGLLVMEGRGENGRQARWAQQPPDVVMSGAIQGPASKL